MGDCISLVGKKRVPGGTWGGVVLARNWILCLAWTV